ncbi:Pyrophosphatase PpaX [Fundidesulfovibrio magnetotacticus]|uniref:phosphoglycolate phosphatase n=1 Tax=Fundidesulfovibrio magnetotacticus TaxID=2730080 RepID=A0A6V8LPH8_9BACT|nr:HAD family hydrolase [Fundidesulfovibrio magnetotacticus]GFK93634.1 Pyrophosphatase PpaX [Fundidesulfovibrio magnetotacticus]
MRTPARLAAVVFDFDGTLARPALDFPLMKRRVGLLAEGFLPGVHEPGPLPALEWIDALAARLEARRARDFRAQALALIADMEREAAASTSLFDFVRPALDRLRGRGVALAVVTRNSRDSVNTVFPDAGRYLGAVLAREDVRAVKPHPEHVLAALRALDRAPGEALMVGDHPQDVQVARAAGTLSAAVSSGDTAPERLARAGPDFLEADAGLLLERLENLGWL